MGPHGMLWGEDTPTDGQFHAYCMFTPTPPQLNVDKCQVVWSVAASRGSKTTTGVSAARESA